MNCKSVTIVGLIIISLLVTCDNPKDEPAEIISDIDGNIYTSVIIGDQEWMVENLRVTRYRNGDDIPNLTSNDDWTATAIGSYCYFNNISENGDTYGALYNGYAIGDSRNISPEGWHITTDAEWQTLIDYLGGNEVAGGKLKEQGTSHWNIPNTGATNLSAFTGLPGGIRESSYGSYTLFGSRGHYWSINEYNSTVRSHLSLWHDNSTATLGLDTKISGGSVRCLRD